MSRNRHSPITADDCSRKSVEAFIKNSDADEKTAVCPSEAKTVPTTEVNKNLAQNGSIESMDTLDTQDVDAPIHINNLNIKCDMKGKSESCNTNIESFFRATQPDCIRGVDKASISDFEDTELSNHAESLSTSSQQDAENVETTIAFQQNSTFLNGGADKPQSELNSHMSGLWPEVSASSFRSSEPHQSNYRLSTTITETKVNSAIEGNSKVVTQNSQVATEQKDCRLLSSVYGPSISNIEKMLTGLQFSSENAENTNISIKNDILQKSNNTEVVKDTVTFKNLMQNYLATEINYSSAKQRDKETEGSEKPEPGSTNYHKNLQSKLKIHIPEISGLDYSELPVHENKKALKFPKITSPQILEQHISKIISENAAIVNTLDPLWSKQYMRQSSLNYNQGSTETESKKVSLSNKLRRVSEDKPTLSALIDSNPSKLQSALLGTLEHKNTIGSLDTTGVPYVPLPSLTVSLSMTSPCTLTYTLPKVVTSVMEEELKGSAIKSLLSLKQGRLSEKNVLKFDKDNLEQHPQNPEGSIIKDLLLKTKSKTKLVAYSDSENLGWCQKLSSENKHVCSCCGLKFLSQDILEAHNAICKEHKNNKFVSKVVKNTKANGTPQLNRDSVDKIQVSLPILNPMALSNSIEVLLKKENSLDNANEDVGRILKKQLLSPFNNQKEPASKKRKISDSFLSTNKLLICEEQNDGSSHESKKSSTSQSLEKVTVLSQRSCSQSVHLFGGEVQVLDGSVTKKIKISTSLSETSPSTTMSVLDNMSHAKCSFYEVQEGKVNSAPLQTVVTIAQPVHNSGGTVTHIPTRDSPPSLTSLMNLPSDVSSNDTEKGSELSPNIWGSIFPAKDLSPIVVNSKKISIEKSVIQKPLSAGDVPELPSCRPFPSSINVKPMAAFSFKPIRENSKSSFSALTKPSSFSVFGKGFLPFKSTLNTIGMEKMQVSTVEPNFSGKLECKSEAMPFQYLVSRPIVRNAARSSIPKVLLTPSSPHSISDEEQSDEDGSSSAKARKLLTPARPNHMRPNSLPLTKKPFTMVGSTLISPETPRPKKACVQLYINGHAYTYLGLKCSTRSTYCCIYRPQPMFVSQDKDPKLSMYSNWQIVPPKEELAGMTPGQMISLYSSKQTSCSSEGLFTTAKTGEQLSFTHSSYWTFRSKERDKNEAQLATNIDKHLPDYSTVINMSGGDSPHSDFIQSSYGSIISDSFLYKENAEIYKRDGRTSPVSDNTSSLEVEASLSDADINNSQDEDEDEDDEERTDVLTDSSQSQAPKRVKIFEGGFKSNEDYTYVRGRGRGKYVCEECGIRCKKPSMLKKHIRTHTDLRPYKCRHCSFAFKTKGNLTKHMKSKAHHKKCTELGIIPVPTSTEDCQIDEEALAKQEQLKRRNQPFSDGESPDDDDDDDDDDFDDSDGLDEDCESDNSSCIMSLNTNNRLSVSNVQNAEFSGSVVNALNTEAGSTATQESILQRTVEQEAARSLLHLSSLSDIPEPWPSSTGEMLTAVTSDLTGIAVASSVCLTPVTSNCPSPTASHKGNELSTFLTIPDEYMGHRPRSYSADVPFGGGREQLARQQQQQSACTAYAILENVSKEAAESSLRDANPRRYSISVAREARKPRSQTVHWGGGTSSNLLLQKWPELESVEQPMDLRVPRSVATIPGTSRNDVITPEDTVNVLNTEIYLNESFTVKPLTLLSSQLLNEYDGVGENSSNGFSAAVSLQDAQQNTISVSQPTIFYSAEGVSVSTARKESDPMDDLPSPEVQEFSICSPVSRSNLDDNCYTPENVVPSPSLLGALKNPPQSLSDFMKPGSSNMEEGKCVCRICNKIFAKAGQLRIHVNIHYFERPFRCDNCGVSFRTKGHLQKHKRSVSHYNKVNMNMTFGTPSIDNPRPFKCADCKIAFRIHGHLAKHLRSKMHIMKLECLGKLPFGMYAEMERSGISLNEIDTTDCNNSLESLQVMAQKLYQRDPRRMRWHSPTLPQSEPESSKCPPSTLRIVDAAAPVSDPLPATHSSPSATAVPMPSTLNLNIPVTNPEGEVKHEPSDVLVFPTTPTFSEVEVPPKTPSVLFANQNIAISSPQPLVRANGSETEINTTLHRSDTCHICGRMFKSAKFLQVHLYCDHSSWNPSSGEVTTSTVITESTSNTSGAVAVQGLTCDLCGRHFSNQNSLQQHLLTHAQPRPFVCEVCDAGFTSSSSLVAHLATHQQISPSNAASTEGGLLQLQ